MGNNDSNLKHQIIYYYLFHKQIESIFNKGYNPFYTKNNSNELKTENFYVINSEIIS